jgi:transcription initiation factor TFIID subunit 10
VTRYFLTLSGCECPDERVTRLVSLATHKFVADLTNDALANCKSRQQARGGKADARLVLTTEDLAASSREFGISLKKPTYYADTPGLGGSSGPPPTDGQP